MSSITAGPPCADTSVTAEDPARMPSYATILDADQHTPPPVFYERSGEELGSDPIDKTTYLSREVHEAEKRTLWRSTWQMACRENDIPEVGDQLVYDIVDQSLLLVRVRPGEIRAFYNSCQHRGNKLVGEDSAHGAAIRCSFHGWTWNLDGSLNRIPCRWDFPGFTDEEVALPQVRVETWNGFVFVNRDASAPPLAEYIGDDLLRHWQTWPRDGAWKVAHLGKVVRANWKLTLEAFLEVYHIVQTHSQAVIATGDCNAQYDTYGPHLRMLQANAVPSPHVGDVDQQEIVDTVLGEAVAAMFADEAGGGAFEMPQLAPGQTARQLVSDVVRQAMGAQLGVDFSTTSDAEMLDTIQYFFFPNFFPWGGYSFPMAYRVRPNGDDHESSIFEVMLFAPLPEGAPLPKDSPLRMTDPDAPWSDEKAAGGLGPIMDQDMYNLSKIQAGVRNESFTHARLSTHQERNIRNFHRYLNSYTDGSSR